MSRESEELGSRAVPHQTASAQMTAEERCCPGGCQRPMGDCVAHLPPAPSVGFMCKTDFDHELGSASDGVKVYPSERALRQERRCVDECGIVKVRVTLAEVVQPSNFFPNKGSAA